MSSQYSPTMSDGAEDEMVAEESGPGAYIVGHNMVGYLPESEPWAASDWESAQRSLIEDMDRAGDHLFDCGDSMRESDPEESARMLDEADELSGAMEDLNLSNGPEWSTIVGYVSYWIVFDPDVSADEYNDESGAN